MNTEVEEQKIINNNSSKKDLANDTVCYSINDQDRLLKLFQIFIEIDNNLKKSNESNI